MTHRRHFLKSLISLPLLGTALPAWAQGNAVDAADLGLVPDSNDDQTAALQRAVNEAANAGRGVYISPGTYRIASLDLPDGTFMTGSSGGTTRFLVSGDAPGMVFKGGDRLALNNLAIEGLSSAGAPREGLIAIGNARDLSLDRVRVAGGAGHGIGLWRSGGVISDCEIESTAQSGIFANDSTGLRITGNRVADCSNGGILVWRNEKGYDGTIVTGNRISGIDWLGGGNGQNGNGINVFRAGGVIISDNVMTDCAFSAVRLNSTSDCLITGNLARGLGEVAIFSEFGFDGSVIADNIVDDAAIGISITNFDSGGRLATCSGNVVRNIKSGSPVNPDTHPVGIGVEADIAVTGNTIDTVPGFGMVVGWGPFLRNVAVTGNMIRAVNVGIGVSVAENAGTALVSGNVIAEVADTAIAGMRWTEMAERDLQAASDRYPQLTVVANQFS
ncbi:TIGR03808 family TAT-translocated repetitive protein [Cucumibacter marinus]|uniref:TIGR03808 family TAT-translocated repetitive protein n=1 Tax=Cucumibacter marinus TaxID=1121252 RepID=UPI00068530F6|nr:TIGR03808 family TAT-translocated repetitive protein [Cucumibacter marinus]